MDEEIKLPPLSQEAFEFGKHYEAPIHKTEPLPKRCDHKGKVKIIGLTIQCQCGSGWLSSKAKEALQLHELLK